MKRILMGIVMVCIILGMNSIGVYAEELTLVNGQATTEEVEEIPEKQEVGWVIEPSPAEKRDTSTSVIKTTEKIYIMGGLPGNKIEVFDTTTNSWSIKNSMDCRSSAVAYADGKIYFFGGAYGITTVDYTTVYDVESERFTNDTIKLPNRQPNSIAIEAEGKIYIMGGDKNDVYIFDYNNLKITKGAPIPTIRKDMGAIYENGKIYTMGGIDYKTGKWSYVMEIYDISTNTWTSGNLVPNEVSSYSGIALNNKLYVASRTSGSPLNIYDTQTNEWLQGPIFNEIKSYPQLILINKKIYALGFGKDSNYVMESLQIDNSSDTEKGLYILLNIGEKVQMSVTSNLMDNTIFTWGSNNKDVATVDLTGNVTALTEGTTVIYVQNEDGSFKESIPVKVMKGNADNYRLAAHVNVGKNIRLYLSDDPSSIQWTSMDESVATVSSLGEVTAISKGLAIIKGVLDGQEYLLYIRVNV